MPTNKMSDGNVSVSDSKRTSLFDYVHSKKRLQKARGTPAKPEIMSEQDFLDLIRLSYDETCKILEHHDLGGRYCGHVSNLADDLFHFICLVEMEETP